MVSSLIATVYLINENDVFDEISSEDIFSDNEDLSEEEGLLKKVCGISSR